MIDLESRAWANVLREGLGAQSLNLPGGGMVTCFKVGPFRVAYPDFLIGSPCDIDTAGVQARIEAAKLLQADLLRLQVSHAPTSHQPFEVHPLGSIVVPLLANWSERNQEKSRRAANRTARSPLLIRPGKETDGAAMHKLYLSTVFRHGGAARYNRRYFELLAPKAATIAELNGDVCGFICVGYQAQRACYMHGAHSQEGRKHYSSDQLFLGMLRKAHESGMTRFDFLPSPPDQRSLIAYKKAWGGKEEDLVVADISLHPLRARSFSLALKLFNSWNSIRRITGRN